VLINRSCNPLILRQISFCFGHNHSYCMCGNGRCCVPYNPTMYEYNDIFSKFSTMFYLFFLIPTTCYKQLMSTEHSALPPQEPPHPGISSQEGYPLLPPSSPSLEICSNKHYNPTSQRHFYGSQTTLNIVVASTTRLMAWIML